jgi:hypothetical protein
MVAKTRLRIPKLENEMAKGIFETFFDRLKRFGLEYFGRYYGIYRATCMENEDPEEQGRIRVRVPLTTLNDTHPIWAWPMAPWAGKDSGFFVVPDVGDPVLVCFENGDPRYPIWVGGYWPKVNGENYAPKETYTNKKPTKRIFKTKAGHELSFEDDPTNQSVKLVWHDAAKDLYTFFSFTKDGSIQMANHKGCFIELRTKDGDERTLIMDKAGNLFTQDKDGTKIVDANGNVVEMKAGTIQLIGTKDVVINGASLNLKVGGVSLGDVPTDSAIKGTTWMAWFLTTFIPHYLAHMHPTAAVGPPSAPSPPPLKPPTNKEMLTDLLKMQ